MFTRVYVQLLDRQQKCLQLVLLPVESFVEVHDDMDPFADFHDDPQEMNGSADCRVHVIYEDTSDIWLNVSVVC